MVLDPLQSTVGASGAVFGLMGAMAVMLRARGENILQTDIGFLILMNLGITFILPGISIGGHLGGLAAGALGGLVLMRLDAMRAPRWTGAAALGALALVLGVVAFVLARGAV